MGWHAIFYKTLLLNTLEVDNLVVSMK